PVHERADERDWQLLRRQAVSAGAELATVHQFEHLTEVCQQVAIIGKTLAKADKQAVPEGVEGGELAIACDGERRIGRMQQTLPQLLGTQYLCLLRLRTGLG